MSTPIRTLSVVAAVAALLAPAVASASPIFPAEVEKHLDLSFTPCCTLCHIGLPSLMTVQNGTLFGKAVLAQGVGAARTDQLDAALDALQKAGTDSDGDTHPDIQELMAGSNPNGAGPVAHNTSKVDTACDSEVPVYGCGASNPGTPDAPMAAEVAGGSNTPWLFAIATGLVLMFAARRRG